MILVCKDKKSVHVNSPQMILWEHAIDGFFEWLSRLESVAYLSGMFGCKCVIRHLFESTRPSSMPMILFISRFRSREMQVSGIDDDDIVSSVD